MKKLIRIYLFVGLGIFLFTTKAAMAGPIIVGGAGEGEYSVVFVRANLPQLLNDCLEFACKFNKEQKDTVSKIASLSLNAPNAVFKNSLDMASSFTIQTDSKNVWINRDHLWLDVDKTVPYDVSDAFGLWIRILASPLGVNSEIAAEISKIAVSAFENQTVRGNIELEDKQGFEFLLWKRGHETRFLTRDPSLQTIDVSTYLNATSLQCPGEVSKMQIYSPAWLPLQTSNSLNSINLTLYFGISWSCGDKFFSTNGLAYFQARRESIEEAWSFNPNSIMVFISPGDVQ
ncbi:MAG: hypothetical protein V4736_05685 [Bdellovibrionota bacterium]